MFAAMLFAISIVALSQFAAYYWRAIKGLGLVRAYYALVDCIASLVGRSMPAVAAWSERELTICARYAAVQIDQRLQANLELAASLRSC